MTLRFRIILILAGVFLIYVLLVIYLQNKLLLPRFLELEDQEAVEDLTRALNAIGKEIESLDWFCRDWSAWDDTWEFMKDHNQEYIEANLIPNTFIDSRLNVIYLVHLNGEVGWGESRQLPSGELINIPELPTHSFPVDHPLLAFSSVEEPSPEECLHGIVMTRTNPLLIVSRPILTTRSHGPVAGAIIMGRFLDQKMIEEINNKTHVHLEIKPLQSANPDEFETQVLQKLENPEARFTHVLDSNYLRVYSYLSDIWKKPALLVWTDVRRDISQNGKQAVLAAQISVALAGFIMLLTVFCLLHLGVTQPIRQLTEHVSGIGETNNLTVRLGKGRTDEIGQLSSAFDQMVENLQKARSALLDQSYESGMAEMASGILHNVRNNLTPIVGYMDNLKKILSSNRVSFLRKTLAALTEPQSEPEKRKQLEEYRDLATHQLLDNLNDLQREIEPIEKLLHQTEALLAEQSMRVIHKRSREHVSIHLLLDEAMELLPARMRKVFELRKDPTLSNFPNFETDRIMVKQVILNLLSNAAEAISHHKPERGVVTVEGFIEQHEQDGFLHLSFVDNGIGFEPEQSGKLFERGYSTKGTRYSGTGLHWCANVMIALGGSIHADSPGIGMGARITLVIPITVS